jgi:predicted RNase H-like HicB family nuclease
MTEKFVVVLTQEEDGWIVAECPSLPGCFSQGRDREEAIENIREAIQLSLETRESEGLSTRPIPTEVTEIQLAVNG